MAVENPNGMKSQMEGAEISGDEKEATEGGAFTNVKEFFREGACKEQGHGKDSCSYQRKHKNSVSANKTGFQGSTSTLAYSNF